MLFRNFLIVLSFSLFLASCNGTIEQKKPTNDSNVEVPEQDFLFSGAENGLWVSNTKISVRFFPAQGGSGKFRYLILDEGGNVKTGSDEEALVKDSDGMYHLNLPGLPSGTPQRFQVRAIDVESNKQDNNSKFVAFNLPNGNDYPDFDGIGRCENFPGGGGQSQMNIFWNKGGIYETALGQTENSVGTYRIYYCKKEFGTSCLENDVPERNVIVVTDQDQEQSTVAGLSANTEYYFRMTAMSRGKDADPATQYEERNIEFASCKTQISSGPILFDGVAEVIIPNNEDGVNQAQVLWDPASGGFGAYKVYYHPVVNDSAPFNVNHPGIQIIDIVDTNKVDVSLIGLDSFTHHAFSVKACKDLVTDPNCSDGNDGGGAFIVKQTKPTVGSFSGISNVRNDVSNPSNVFLDFVPADLTSGGIFDQYKVFISDGTNTYDISDSNATNKLGAIFPSAPADYQDLYLEGFVKTNITTNVAQLNGLKPSIVYQTDVQAWVDRVAPLPISGGNIVAQYGSIGTVPVPVTNSDTTPPQIISFSVSPAAATIRLTETITIIVGYNETLSVTGNPRIGLNIGGVTRYATAISNTTTTITFEYTAGAGDNDLDGITFDGTSISLNGGIVSDLSGNNASLNFVALVPDTSALFVDTVPPSPPVGVVFTDQWLSTADLIQQASWTNPTDDFDHAEIAIGAAGSGIPNAVPYSASTGVNTHTFPDITGGLSECAQEYEVLVRALDSAGLASAPAISASTFRIDKTAPSTVTTSLVGTTSNIFEANEVSWTAATDTCSLHHYEIAIGKDDDSDGFDAGDENNVMAWTEVPGGISTGQYQANSGFDGMTFTLNDTDTFRVSIRAVDEAGNVSVAGQSPDFIVDIAGPSTPTDLAIGGSWISGALPQDAPEVTWTNPGDADFDVSRIALGTGVGQDDVRSDQNVGTFEAYTFTGLTGLTECQKIYPRVTAYDDIGNPSAPASSPSVFFAYDNTAPTASGDIDISAGGEDRSTNTAPLADFLPFFPADNCTDFDYFEISIGYDDDSDGFDAGDVANTLAFTEVPGGDSVNQYQAISGTDGMFFTFTAGVDYFISMRVVDFAGNVSNVVTSSSSFTFILDNTAPTVALSTTVTNPTFATSIPLTITFDEDVTGFDASDLIITNGTAAAVTGGPQVYETTITPDDFGRITVNVNPGAASDGAGNPNAVAPELGVLYASSDAMQTQWTVTAGATVTLPLRNGYVNDFFVDWGDGTPPQEVTAYNDADASHTYASAGVYTVTCTGILEAWYFNSGGSRNLLTSVPNLGTMRWRSLDSAFQGAENLLSLSGGDVSGVTSMYEMFYNAYNITTINAGSWDTSNVTRMDRMFHRAYAANPVTTGWDTSSVTNMYQMFDYAYAANPDTSGWDVGNVTNMAYMFRRAYVANPNTASWDTGEATRMDWMFERAAVANPDTSGWDTAKVTNMNGMFYLADVANPNTSGWDTSNVTTMYNMFRDADAANPDTSGWDTAKVTNMHAMFYGAAIANPNTSGWDTALVTNMSAMFTNALAANPNTSGWDTGNVTDMNSMFNNADFANPDTSSWNTSRVVNMSNMFVNNAIANPDTSGWDVSKVTSMSQMFYNADSANPDTSSWTMPLCTSMYRMFRGADVANPVMTTWNTSLVNNMQEMFYDADSAVADTMCNLDVSGVVNMQNMFGSAGNIQPCTTNWDTSAVQNMNSMFSNTPLANPIVTSWDTSSVTNMQNMFNNADSAQPNTTSWDTSSVTSMYRMFYNSNLANPNVSGWDTSNVTSMRDMFRNADSATPDVSSWDTSSVTTMQEMFRDASSVNPDISGWDTSNVTNMYAMFYNCPSANVDFTGLNLSNVTTFRYIFYQNFSMTNDNYGNYLVELANDLPTASPKEAYANQCAYPAFAASARSTLSSNGWTFVDQGAE